MRMTVHYNIGLPNGWTLFIFIEIKLLQRSTLDNKTGWVFYFEYFIIIDKK